MLGGSPNINFSKSKGLFVKEYKLVNGPIVIDTTVVCDFYTIWVEKIWRYGKWRGEVEPFEDNQRGSYQLIIETDETCLINFEKNWYSLWSWEDNLRISGKDSFMKDMHNAPDTIILPVFSGKGNVPKSFNGEHRKIGEFVLVKI